MKNVCAIIVLFFLASCSQDISNENLISEDRAITNYVENSKIFANQIMSNSSESIQSLADYIESNSADTPYEEFEEKFTQLLKVDREVFANWRSSYLALGEFYDLENDQSLISDKVLQNYPEFAASDLKNCGGWTPLLTVVSCGTCLAMMPWSCVGCVGGLIQMTNDGCFDG